MAKKESNDPLRVQLEEARGKLEGAERDLEKAKATLHGLNGRISDMVNRRQTKVFLKEQCEQEKPELLRRIALGELSEEALHEKTREIEKLTSEIKDLDDLHQTTLKTKGQTEGDVRKALQQVDGFIHEFWFVVSRIEAAKVATNEQLLKAWVASQLARTVMSFGDFLRTVFGSYNVGELGALREELFKTYGRREG